MKNLRVEAKVRNNILYHLIYDNYKNVSDFSKKTNLTQFRVGELLNLKYNPFKKNGEYISMCIKIAEHFKMLPEDIFPASIYGIESLSFVKEFSFSQIDSVNPMLLSYQDNLAEQIDLKQFENDVKNVLKTIPKKEADVIKLRHGFEGEKQTYKSIGLCLGVTGETVRQIEAKGLRRLRHPTRKVAICKHLEYSI